MISRLSTDSSGKSPANYLQPTHGGVMCHMSQGLTYMQPSCAWYTFVYRALGTAGFHGFMAGLQRLCGAHEWCRCHAAAEVTECIPRDGGDRSRPAHIGNMLPILRRVLHAATGSSRARPLGLLL